MSEVPISPPHTICIAARCPSYSEVWRDRMSQLLAPHVSDLYFQPSRNSAASPIGYPRTALLPLWTSYIPNRVCLSTFPRAINRRFGSHVRETKGRVRLLIHYVTNAVLLEDTLRNLELPTFVHCHGHDVTWDRRIEKLPFLRAQPRNYVKMVRELACYVQFIANSQATVAALESIGIPNERIHLKYLGVDVPAEYPSKEERELTILYVGRLTDFKGPVETIQAFDKACARGLRGQLLIAGGGNQEKACSEAREHSRFKERVQMLGPVSAERVQELLGRADIFTAHNKMSPLTGQQEALGISVLEAMAVGIPVVTGRSGGVCETVVAGETGILFEPGDVDAHADALLKLAEDPAYRRSLGIAGYERARDRFSLERERNELLAILDKVTSRQEVNR